VMKTLFVFIFICSLNLSLCEECNELVNNLTQKFQEKIKETEDRLMLKFQVEIARKDEQLIQLESKLEAELAKKDEQITSKLKDIIRDDFTKYLEENKEMVPLYEIQDTQEFSSTLHYINNKELIDASANGRIKAVNRLVAEGADTNWKNWFGKSSIILAASFGHQQVVRILLAHGADINSTNSLILGMEDLEMVKLLLDNGADVNYIYIEGGYSSLMWAVSFNRKEKLLVLLDYDADVNIKDDKGRTALDLVRNKEIEEILIQHGAIHGGDID